MITVESLTRRYAGFTAVDNVSFTAQPGRVTGFLGPNGGLNPRGIASRAHRFDGQS